MKNKPILLCLTGYTGVGKTTVKNMFAQYPGVKTFYTKDLHKIILGHQAKKIDKMYISTKFTDKLGFIQRVMDCVDMYREDAKVIVLDSVRSTDELEYIKTLPQYCGVRLIHVTCDNQLRLTRLQKRDNCDLKTIEKRDAIDTGKDNMVLFNMHDLFKRKDYTIINSNSLEEINEQVCLILQTLPKQICKSSKLITPNNKEKQNG